MAIDLKTGYRKYLNEKGFKDDEITYDNGSIYAKGKFFGAATPEADGSTYDTRGNLDKAFNNYQRQNTVDEMAGLKKQLQERINKPVGQFTYDAQSDPLYKNALDAAQRGAQTASNNAMVQMGRRGIGNSQSAVTAANSIQQRAIADVNSNVLPQLNAQAYQRFLGQQQQENVQADMAARLMDYLGNENQRQLDNEYRGDVFADKQKNDRIAQQQWGVNTYGYGDAKNDYGEFTKQYEGAVPLVVQQLRAGLLGYLGDERTMEGRQLDDALLTSELQRELSESDRTGTFRGQDTEQKKSRLFNQGAESSRIGLSAAGQSLSRDRFAWEKDPTNPDNIYKQAQINKLNAPEQQRANVNSLASSLSRRFLQKDEDGNLFVNDPDGLEASILSTPMSDEEYEYLYNYFGLEIPR